MLAFLQRWKEACEEFSQAFRLNPSNYNLLYSIGVCKHNLQSPDAEEYFLSFIEAADVDARKVPIAYYFLGCIAMVANNHEKAEEYYNLGIQSESYQLPCFLPIDHIQKQLLQAFVSFNSKTFVSSKISTTNSSTNEENLTKEESRLKDPRRIQKILKIREWSNHPLLKMSCLVNSAQPFKSSKSPKSLANLKNVFIEDLDLAEDKVHEGCVLTGILIEHPVKIKGIYSILEDDKGQVERIAFYNFNDTSKIQVGSRLSIISPYVRIAQDGECLIRVDSPDSVIFLSVDYKHICGYCGMTDKEKSLMQCSKCMMTYYCSRECQVKDWKQLKHNFICKKAN
jgi:hypothetical protein